MKIRITVLGSGTSVGVPTIGCSCDVCRSTDPRDKRLRPSLLVQYNGNDVIVDATPDFRTQVLRLGLTKLDGILLSHAHADHILGLDDVRPFNYHRSTPIPVYGHPDTLAIVRRIFQYAFTEGPRESSSPKLDLLPIDESPVELFGLSFTRVPLRHGSGLVYGFRFGRIAYLTDHSDIPESSLPLLQDLDILFLDALRHKPHKTHTTVADALQWAQRIGARRTYFTHMCHDLGHAQTEADFPDNVRLSYDGLVLESE